MPKISGGCLCGAVRYECNAEPLGTAICHCTHCQKVSGSAFSVNVVVPAPSLTWQGQSLASYADKGESGKPLSRKFCRNCGSSLTTEAEALPGAIIIKAGTLDDKSWLKPNYHIWTNSAQPWVRIEPGRRHFQKAGPEDLAHPHDVRFSIAKAVADSNIIANFPERLAHQIAALFGLRVYQPPVDLAPISLAMVRHRRNYSDAAHVWFRQRC